MRPPKIDLSNSVARKFIDIIDITEFEIETDTGWSDISSIGKTVKYTVWKLETEDGLYINCADTHIVFNEEYNQVFVKDLKIGDKIITKNGISKVSNVNEAGISENMYDIKVNDDNHRYWTNDILSHNTSILNALTYAIYNKPYENISLPRLINSTNAAKNTLMEVEYTFERDAVYEVFRKRGESHGVTVLRDGVDITPDSVNETDALIETIYGFSYEMFTRCIVFAGSSTPFLDMPVSHQRNHIEELFNITILSEKAVKLKKNIQTTESDIKVEEAVLKEKESNIKIQNKRLVDMETKLVNWEQNNEQQKVNIRAKLQQVEGIDFTAEHELFNLKSDLQSERSTAKNELSSAKRAVVRLNEQAAKFRNELDHLTKSKCPYCLQSLPDADVKIAELETNQQNVSEELHLKLADVITYSSLLNNIEDMLEDINSKIKYDNLPALMETKANSAVLEAQLKQLEQAENPYFETYEQLEKDTIVKPDYNRLDELKSRVEHQIFLLKLLIDKNSFIRRRIISRTIPFLNLQMNNYSRILGLPHIVQFKDDMSCTVTQFGRELDFGNLSSGEKKRVNLAMSLAFRDVLHHLHAKVNLLFVDEIDASLCPLGVENVISLLKSKTKQDDLSTWIVMHRIEAQGKFDRDLIVHKRNGFSELEFRVAQLE